MRCQTSMRWRPALGCTESSRMARDSLPLELAADVLRGGCEVASAAGCPIAGGHSIDDPEPKYGMAVIGTVALDQVMRIDAGRAGLPLSLTKPLGIGTLNTRHKQTGDTFPHTIATMTALNDVAFGACSRKRGSVAPLT